MSKFEVVSGIIQKLGDGQAGVVRLLAEEGITVSPQVVAMWQARGRIPRISRGARTVDGERAEYRSALLRLAARHRIALTEAEARYLGSLMKDPLEGENV